MPLSTERHAARENGRRSRRYEKRWMEERNLVWPVASPTHNIVPQAEGRPFIQPLLSGFLDVFDCPYGPMLLLQVDQVVASDPMFHTRVRAITNLLGAISSVGEPGAAPMTGVLRIKSPSCASDLVPIAVVVAKHAHADEVAAYLGLVVAHLPPNEDELPLDVPINGD